MAAIDLWRMVSALGHANHADTDEHALAALREAAGAYHDPFADGHDPPWTAGYVTTFRDHVVDVQARIAEILEIDHPDAAPAARDTAIGYDPVCEELYQRAMRIQGRLGRTDAVAASSPAAPEHWKPSRPNPPTRRRAPIPPPTRRLITRSSGDGRVARTGAIRSTGLRTAIARGAPRVLDRTDVGTRES